MTSKSFTFQAVKNGRTIRITPAASRAAVIIGLILFALFFLIASTGYSQRLQEITVDLNSAVLQAYVPFDEPFLIKGEVDNEAISMKLTIDILNNSGTAVDYTKPAIDVKFISVGKNDVKTKFAVEAGGLPPNRKIKLTFAVRKKVASLPDFTDQVKAKIEALNKQYAISGIPFTNAQFLTLQSDLITLFNSKFSQYTPVFTGTLLAGAGALADLTNAQTLLIAVHAAGTTISGQIAAIRNPMQDVRNAPHIQAFYREAVASKRTEVVNLLSQIIGLTDSEAIALMKGFTAFDEKLPGAIAKTTSFDITPDLTEADALVAKENLEKSAHELMIARAFIETSIKSNNALQVSLIGGNPAAGVLQNYQNEITDISNNLLNASNALRAQALQYEKLSVNSRKYKDKMTAFMSAFTFSIENGVVLEASSFNTFETRGSWYISADAGLISVPKLKEVQPAYGAILYFSPVNKSCRYRASDIKEIYHVTSKWDIGKIWLKKHVGVTIGLTTKSMKDADRRTEDLWGSSNLLIGAGVRLGSALRLSGGSMVFRSFKDGNLLNTEKHLAMLPYVAISVDIDLLKAFGKIGTSLFP